MILEPIPEIIVIDEPDVTGGSAPAELDSDSFSISVSNDSNGYPVYTVTKEHSFVFTSSYCSYTFKIKTSCSTYKDKTVKVDISTYYDSKNQFAKPTTYNPSVILKAKYGSAEKNLYTYKKNTVDKTWHTTSNAFANITLPKFYQSYNSESEFDEWSGNINNGTYKPYGSDFTGINGCKKIDSTWYHVSYFGEDIFSNSIQIYCKEDNDINSYDRENTFTLDVPFSDCPLPLGLPVLKVDILSVGETSVTYRIDTDYNFAGRILDAGLIIYKINGSALSRIAGHSVVQYFYKNELPKTLTLNGLSLTAGETYYLGSGNSSNGEYDLTHRVTVTSNGKTIEKIPFKKGKFNNIGECDPYFMALEAYRVPFITETVQKDENGEYYGGYGINAIPFSFAATPITNIQLNNSITDVDLLSSSSTSFSVGLTITPSDFTRSAQPLTIKSSNSGVIGVKSNGGGSTSKTFNRTESTNIYFFARSAGTSTLTIESENDPSIKVSFNVRVHVPVSSIDSADPQAKAGVKVILDLAGYANTTSGKQTSDKITRILNKSSHVNVAILSGGSQISLVSPPIAEDQEGVFRQETVSCAVGDTYNGTLIERDRTFDINFEVIPSKKADMFEVINDDNNKPSLVSNVLSFDSIRQMFDNLVPIMNGLNGIADGRWLDVDSITKDVDVTLEYKMGFSDLLTQLNNLEIDIKNIITPVSNYLIQKDSSYFETHSQERAIRDAISVLYPQYPSKSLDDISTASFATTLVTGIDKINRHEFIQTRYEWCNRMINALNV